MIVGLAGLPKKYAIIRTVILGRESSITLKEFQAQLLGVEKEIEGDITMLTQNMSALYSQGSSSNNGFSQSSGSTPNLQGHSHILATIGRVITHGPYNLPLIYYPIDPYIPPPGYPLIPLPVYFPTLPFGFGFVGNANNGSRSGYKGNNNFKSNGGYKGKNFNSGASRQNNNGSQFANTQSRTNVVIECQICNKRGHIVAYCFQRNKNAHSYGFMVECQICGERGHVALEYVHRGNYAYQGQPSPPSLNVMTA